MASGDDIRPFRISVSDDQLYEISEKLKFARFPDELDLPESQRWDWGIPLSVLKPAVEYWRTKYDWRAVEARINDTLPQFITHVNSPEHGPQEVHFVHKRSKNPNATPLIFVHGWPGNFLEVSKIIDQLTDPTDPKAPSFHVVAPSLPGFVFSQRASIPGMNAKATAFMFNELMLKLGYTRYLGQGGDWGSLVNRVFAANHQDTCFGVHLNMPFADPPSFLKNPFIALRAVLGFSGLPGGLSTEEVNALKEREAWMRTSSGYLIQQGTRPQTLAAGLADSPVGLLAWIGEKLYTWTDNYPWTPEEMITWTMLYWVAGPAGGLRYYKENGVADQARPARGERSPTPIGFSVFPKEIIISPLEWIAAQNNLVYFKKHNRGGHFAAWEVPDLLVEDIRNFANVVLNKDVRPQSSLYPTILVAVTAIACAALALPRVAPHLLREKI